MTTETAESVPAPAPATETIPADGAAPAPKKERRRKPRKERAPAAAGDDAAPAKPEEEDNTHKVFFGNLAFNTTEEQLKTFCAPAGEVVKVEIITRGTRSLGYAFVGFNTEDEAKKAVELFDKKELEGREINVEVAKPRETAEAKAARAPKAPRKGGRASRGGRRRAKKAAAEGEGETTEKRVDDEEGAEGEGAPTGEGRRGRGGRARGAGAAGASAPRRRFPRAARELNADGSDPRGPPSETLLFVANLPFKVTDDDLKAIFKDYKVATAKVVRLRSGKSKGFGFVEVESHEEQQRVLSELTNVVVDSRELVIKVALANAVTTADPEESAAEGEAAPAAEETKA